MADTSEGARQSADVFCLFHCVHFDCPHLKTGLHQQIETQKLDFWLVSQFLNAFHVILS